MDRGEKDGTDRDIWPVKTVDVGTSSQQKMMGWSTGCGGDVREEMSMRIWNVVPTKKSGKASRCD
jgi:hypothetical protein